MCGYVEEGGAERTSLWGAIDFLSNGGLCVLYLHSKCSVLKEIFNIVVYVPSYSHLKHFYEYCWVPNHVKGF